MYACVCIHVYSQWVPIDLAELAARVLVSAGALLGVAVSGRWASTLWGTAGEPLATMAVGQFGGHLG